MKQDIRATQPLNHGKFYAPKDFLTYTGFIEIFLIQKQLHFNDLNTSGLGQEREQKE